MEYIVTPFSNEHGAGGGGDCKGYCYTKMEICNTLNSCGTKCNKVDCLVKWGN